MADITLLEAAKHSKSQLEAFVTKIIVETSPILEYLPMKTITGPALRYHRESSLGSIDFRGVGGTYTADAGVINPLFEALVIMGGEVSIDNFEVKTMGNLLDLKTAKYRMKARKAGITFTETFFEGDTATDPYAFDGLRKRLSGNQLIGSSVGVKFSAAGMKLPILDEVLDAVIGDNSDKILFMSAATRRALTAVIRAETGSGLITFTQDTFGKQQMKYAGATIRIIAMEDDASTIFGFDEDPGDAASDTCSIYCVRFGSEYVHGIQSSPLPSVKDFGEVEAKPAHMGRIEWFCGLVLKHPRCAARIKGILTE